MNHNTEPTSAAESFQKLSMFESLSDEEIEIRNAEAKKEQDSANEDKFIKECGLQKRHLHPPTPLGGDGWIAAKARIDKRIGRGFIIALCGPRGTGKTQIATECARMVARSGKSPKYTKAMSFFLAIKESFNGKKSERSVIEDFSRPRLLIIDEMQERGESAWEDRLLTHLIDQRYGDMKDTILITNQTSEEFVQAIGPSVASRLTETGGIITCDWPSYR